MLPSLFSTYDASTCSRGKTPAGVGTGERQRRTLYATYVLPAAVNRPERSHALFSSRCAFAAAGALREAQMQRSVTAQRVGGEERYFSPSDSVAAEFRRRE